MKKRTVYLSEDMDGDCVAFLKNRYNVVDNFDNPSEIEGIISRKIPVTKEIIESCPNLKIVSDHGTGMDQIDLEECRKAGVKVTNTPGLNAESVAELVTGFMISSSFKMKMIDRGLEKGAFARFGLEELNGNEISGKKVGLVGSGFIAQKLSAILRNGFGCKIYCWNPRRDEAYLERLGFTKVNTLEELFEKMDFISIHIPLTDETVNLIDEKILKHSNQNLVLINTARGGIVNEKDLYEALKNHVLKAACLDVFEEEPPSKDNPLFTLDNFIGTFHVGGSTEEALKRVGRETVRNLMEGLGETYTEDMID